VSQTARQQFGQEAVHVGQSNGYKKIERAPFFRPASEYIYKNSNSAHSCFDGPLVHPADTNTLCVPDPACQGFSGSMPRKRGASKARKAPRKAGAKKAKPKRAKSGAASSRRGRGTTPSWEPRPCGACGEEADEDGDDPILQCFKCGDCVHQGCYGCSDADVRASMKHEWQCDPCVAGVQSPRCVPCGSTTTDVARCSTYSMDVCAVVGVSCAQCKATASCAKAHGLGRLCGCTSHARFGFRKCFSRTVRSCRT